MGNVYCCPNSSDGEDSRLESSATSEREPEEANMDFTSRSYSQTSHVRTVQFPIRPIAAKEQTGSDSMKRAMQNYQAGNYLAAMKICRAHLVDNRTDYEAQLLLGRSMASYEMLKCAEDAFRTAIEIDKRDHRGWKGLSELLESSNQRTTELFEMYLTMLTSAKPKLKEEWTEICDKALKLHTELGGKSTVNMKLRHIRSGIRFSAGYPDVDDAVIGIWTDLVYSRPTKLTAVDEIIIKAACRMVKDSPKSSKVDQMKCDIILSMTCKAPWPEVEAKCLLVHRLYPSEKLPMQILAKQYIKKDMGCIQDRAVKIYQDLQTADKQSSLAAIGLGQSLLVQQDYQSAIIWLTKGVALDEHNVYGWLYLAKAQLAVRDLKEAHKSSVKGLELLRDKPNTSSTHSIRSQLEMCRSQSAVESNDTITAIAALVEMIPLQSLKKQTPTDLYQKLVQACKHLHDQRDPFRQARAESMQDWRRGKRADYQLQHAIKHWENGMETRTDPWMFLTSILKALKQDPWNADVFFFLGRYLWEVLAELRLGKEFLELANKLRQDSETGSYLVDICLVLQDKRTAVQVLTSHLRSSPIAKWIWLRLGVLQMNARDYNQAETSFWKAINADSRSNRQPYECLARNRLRRLQIFDAIKAFEIGAKLESHYFHQMFTTQLSAKDVLALEATDLRAIYSDTEQWISNPTAIGVQFAFSILYAICPDLLRPVGFDFSRVTQARKAITNVYSNGGLCQPGQRIDWKEADKQCAYMLRFFLIHCQFVPRLLTSTPNILTKFPAGNHLRVCCVGGGPGSDIVGLLTFLRSINRSARLTCHVLDKFPAWENVWKHIQPRLPPPSVNVSYASLDITSPHPLGRQVVDAISQADIVTFVKSVSPTVAFLKNPRLQMQQYPFMPVQSPRGAIPIILRTLKTGALVIYIDNRHGDQNPIFHQMAISEGLRLLYNRIWICDITANVAEYDALYNGRGCKACSSCSLQGYVFYKP